MGLFDFLKWRRPEPGEEPEYDLEIARVREKFDRVKRISWKPETRPGDGDRQASKFSGIPWIAPGEEWPVCPNCSTPMQLFVQLNLADLPARPPGCLSSGLVQLFYCVRKKKPCCESDCKAWDPGAKSVVARLVQPDGEGRPFESNPVADAFPPKLITGWTEITTFPEWDETQELDAEITSEDHEILLEEILDDDDYDLGEKLMGWPTWVQGPRYPDCPICGTRMEFLFQIGSNDNLPYMFGDAGTGHLMQCSKHPHSLVFSWDCH